MGVFFGSEYHFGVKMMDRTSNHMPFRDWNPNDYLRLITVATVCLCFIGLTLLVFIITLHTSYHEGDKLITLLSVVGGSAGLVVFFKSCERIIRLALIGSKGSGEGGGEGATR